MDQYSFKSLSAVFSDPLGGQLVIQGQIGAGQIMVENATEHAAQDVSADGNVLQSAIAGDNGHLTVECQQTSIVHKFLLNCWNARNAAMQSGDTSLFFAMTCTLRNPSDGQSHRCKGGGIGKIPGKPYAAQGQKMTWVLPFGDIQNLNA